MSNHETQVIIPNCTITHIINLSTVIPLATGDLTLTKYSPAASNVPSAPVAIDLQAPTAVTTSVPGDNALQRNTADKPVFTLQVGQMAFPLSKSTVFGTDTTSSRRYMFVPNLGPNGQDAQGGYIRLDLPESAIEPIPSEFVDGLGQAASTTPITQRDLFEQALLEEGLLKEGFEAIREDITRSLKEAVDVIRDKVTNALSTDSGRTPAEALESEK